MVPVAADLVLTLEDDTVDPEAIAIVVITDLVPIQEVEEVIVIILAPTLVQALEIAGHPVALLLVPVLARTLVHVRHLDRTQRKCLDLFRDHLPNRSHLSKD